MLAMGFFDRPDGTWLSRRFGARIEIEITDGMIVFRKGTETVALPPRLFVSGNRVVGFGTSEAPSEQCVDVLASPDPAMLSKLFVHGFIRVMRSTFMIRPNVRVTVATTRVPRERVVEALKLAGVRNFEVV
jgi:hypothetical protein